MCCVLGQNTLLSQCHSPPRCINGYCGIVREALQNAGGGGGEKPCDGLPSLPGGSSNIPSCFMLHGNQSKLRLGGPTGSSTDLIFKQ